MPIFGNCELRNWKVELNRIDRRRKEMVRLVKREKSSLAVAGVHLVSLSLGTGSFFFY